MSVFEKLALNVPQVRRAYNSLAAATAEIGSLRDEASALLARVTKAEQDERSFAKRFFHYHATFDPVAVIDRNSVAGLQATPGYLTNCFGVKIDVRFLPSILPQFSGTVEGPTNPNNWHTDISELGAALRSVELASGEFTVIELGCGWGCWTNITGVVARRLGKKVHLIGVEGDAGHVEFARRAFADNGFSETEYTLLHGIAAAKQGRAFFPKDDQSGIAWGKAPVFIEEGAPPLDRTDFAELPMIALTDIASDRRIDLLHIDIQGGEADLLARCVADIAQSVAYICIGTHSREIEGRLFEIMINAGWRLEIERPAIYHESQGRLVLQVDGVQGWRNPNLLP